MGLLVAVTFRTRVPLLPGARANMRRVTASQGWFPVVGLLLGALLLAVDQCPSDHVDLLSDKGIYGFDHVVFRVEAH